MNLKQAKVRFLHIVDNLSAVPDLCKLFNLIPGSHVHCIWFGKKKDAWFAPKTYPNGLVVTTVSDPKQLRGRNIFCLFQQKPHEDVKDIFDNAHLSFTLNNYLKVE